MKGDMYGLKYSLIYFLNCIIGVLSSFSSIFNIYGGKFAYFLASSGLKATMIIFRNKKCLFYNKVFELEIN